MRRKGFLIAIIMLGTLLFGGCGNGVQPTGSEGGNAEESVAAATQVPVENGRDGALREAVEPVGTPEPAPVPTTTPIPTATPIPTPEPFVEDTNVYGNTPGNVYNGGFLCEDEENYYIYFSYYDCVYRTDKKTGASTVLGTGQLMEMNVLEDCLYGSRYGDVNGLFCVNMATGEETLVKEGNITETIVVNREVYFLEDTNRLCKLNLDTKEETCLVEEGVQIYAVYKDSVYFTTQTDNLCIYSVPGAGGEPLKLNETASFLPLVYKDRIYYIDASEEVMPICSMKLDGSDVEVLEGTDAGFMNIHEGILYYIGRSDPDKVYRVDLESEEPVIQEFELEAKVEAGIREYSSKAFTKFHTHEIVGLNFWNNHMLFLGINNMDGNYYGDEFLYDMETDKVLPLGFFCYEEPVLPAFTVEDVNKVMYAQSAVNVRSGPSTDYEKIGNLSQNEQVQVTGMTSTGWYRIEANGQVAYVSQKYLGDALVVVATPTPARSYPPGDYGKGTVYGPKLNQTERDQVADAVQNYLNSYDFTNMSEYDKVATAHDYLCSVCSYAPDWSKNRANTAWGALIYGEAQCSGYARAMKALCDAMGVGCYYVHADEHAFNPSHQWNTVCIDGNWYIIDVQGNDSSGGRFFYLLSDDTYMYMSGMSWDRSAIPPCPKDYFQ